MSQPPGNEGVYIGPNTQISAPINMAVGKHARADQQIVDLSAAELSRHLAELRTLVLGYRDAAREPAWAEPELREVEDELRRRPVNRERVLAALQRLAVCAAGVAAVVTEIDKIRQAITGP
jgi:hypothetical protein